MTAQKGGPTERDRLLRKFLAKRGKGRRNRQAHVTVQIAEPAAAEIAEHEAVELTAHTPHGAYASTLDDPLLRAVDAWRAVQPTNMTLDEATRELVKRGLDRPTRWSIREVVVELWKEAAKRYWPNK